MHSLMKIMLLPSNLLVISTEASVIPGPGMPLDATWLLLTGGGGLARQEKQKKKQASCPRHFTLLITRLQLSGDFTRRRWCALTQVCPWTRHGSYCCGAGSWRAVEKQTTTNKLLAADTPHFQKADFVCAGRSLVFVGVFVCVCVCVCVWVWV